MQLESDEEFVAAMRARFASRPYSNNPLALSCSDEYWTDERYEELIADLLKTQQVIRAAIAQPSQRSDDLSVDDWDLAAAKWAMWSIATHDVGATPTPWHRIWSAVRSVIMWTRYDEQRRIGEAIRKDQTSVLGPTASKLIENVIAAESGE